MTRQLPKPVAVPLGWLIFGAINGLIYAGGWVLMRCDDLSDEITARRVGREAEAWLKDGAR